MCLSSSVIMTPLTVFVFILSHIAHLNAVTSRNRPNVIFILLDDQDIMLNSPSFMPVLQSEIVQKGITFRNAFVNTPVCCPSRTETITGRYYHNLGAPHGSCMHIDAQGNVMSNHSIYSVLHNNGYKVGLFGKITNQDSHLFCENKYNVSQYGMDRVYSPCAEANFYWTSYFDKHENGTEGLIHLDRDDPATYSTAVKLTIPR